MSRDKTGYLVIELDSETEALKHGKIIASRSCIYSNAAALHSQLLDCPPDKVRVLLKVIKVAQHKQIKTEVVIEDVE